MKIIIPYIGALRCSDARIVQLAEFLGISYETLALANVADHAAFLEKKVPDQCSCFHMNPQVMKEWVGPDGIPAKLVSFLLARFAHIFVHSLRLDAFDSKMVAALSGGRLQSVNAIGESCPAYEIARDSKHVCGPFSGLSFGPANPVNDHVFSIGGGDTAVRPLISIGGRPFMAAVRRDRAEVVFVASEEVADLNAEVGDAPLAEYFSKFVPHAMALRYATGNAGWQPDHAYSSIIIDDPLLRKSYGLLNFESLLRLAERHNFHAVIAFIPHNFRRSSPQITHMFRENAKRLSICFHGNDHTNAELASTDMTLLNTMLHVAEHRMNLHSQMTKLPCDRVMVFPQGRFSIEAMRVLKSHNFDAAVNTVSHPVQQVARLTIGELARPAVLRYGGFPLFLRKPIRDTQRHDIAFNLFFGRPTLIVEHHDVFRRAESLVEIATMINSVAPDVRWSSLASVVGNSMLRRIVPDGTHQVLAYSGTVRISNTAGSIARFSIEWGGCDGTSVDQVLVDGAPYREFKVDKTGIRLSVELAAGSSQTFSLAHRNVDDTVRKLGLRWSAHAFVRRRLSEVRDNYLSKNESLLTAFSGIQRHLVK